ncbi:hypothetical protein P7C70_g4287, partial [Phenoliferia sp. Uapishka_3]
MSPAVALVGATGLVGRNLLATFLQALKNRQISSLNILTTSDNPALVEPAKLEGVKVFKVDYSNTGTLDGALEGVGILVSAMGMGKEAGIGSYEVNKGKLIEAAARMNVKVYVPSEFGTDHNTEAAKGIGSVMFDGKQVHHAKAESLGLRVIAMYTGLLLEISFSAWLGIDSSVINPTWSLPTPSRPVAFTSLHDVGPYVLSASCQAFSGANDIPSRARIYSDLITLDSAADIWEEVTGEKITRTTLDQVQLAAKYEEIKPTLAIGMLGPAIPLLISQGAFDHGGTNANGFLRRGDWNFEPTSVRDFFKTLPLAK